METKKAKTTVLVGLLALAGLAVIFLPAYAGNLEPSAPPGPTMKTLDEVEPRIPIHASDLPLTITEPNSYYFTETIEFESNDANAITIDANDVTIDLAGFSLIGPGSGTGCGIYMNGRCHVEIRNGKIEGFGSHGIADKNFIDPNLLDGKGHRIICMRIVSNGGSGVYLVSSENLVKDCSVGGNGDDGIYTYLGSTVTGNTVYDNNDCGILAGAGSTVMGNTVYNNMGYCGILGTGGTGTTISGNTVAKNHGHGIYGVYGSAIIGNSVNNNEEMGIEAHGSSVIGNSVFDNNDDGIWVTKSTVTDNAVYGNTSFGIRADQSIVTNNTVSDNGTYSTDAGIVVLFSCLVKGNTVCDNTPYNIRGSGRYSTIEANVVTNMVTGGTGIYVSNTDNIIIGNKASNNATNYDIAAGNAYGQIRNVAGGGSFINTDPTANFEF